MTTPLQGCYVDASYGTHAIDLILAAAESFGFKYENVCDCDYCQHHEVSILEDLFEPRLCEFANEIEDEIDDWMNKNVAMVPLGTAPTNYWGRNDNGDWGLWPSESA